MLTQAEKGAAFHALHSRDGAFIIPNPWDSGTTRVLEHLGFEALATTSAGYAFSVGQRDNTIGRLTTKDDISAVVRSVDRPVNVVMALQGVQLSLAALSAIGVKRISVGSALARAAFGAVLRAAREMRERGTFAFADEADSYRDITAMLATSPRPA